MCFKRNDLSNNDDEQSIGAFIIQDNTPNLHTFCGSDKKNIREKLRF